MPPDNKLFKYSRLVNNLKSTDTIAVGIKQEDGSYLVKNIAFSDFLTEIQNDADISIEFAIVQALAEAQYLHTGQFILIPDATAANIPLLVQAVSSSAIHTDAKSPDFPQDVIQYDFEHDVILWRWDTINDISVAQDLRNLVNLTIGSGGQHIHCESGVFGSIGTNVTNVHVGTESEIDISNGSDYINVGSASYFSGTGANRRVRIGDETSFMSAFNLENIIADDGISVIGPTAALSDVHFRAGCDISVATWIYSDGSKTVQATPDGAAVLLYVSSGGTLQIKGAEE